MITILSPENGAELSLVTEYHREFMQHEIAGEHREFEDGSYTHGWLQKYVRSLPVFYGGRAEALNLTRPTFVKFQWKSDVPCHLVIDRIDGRVYPGDPIPEVREFGCCGCCGVSSAEAGNLFADSRYSWRIVADDGSEASEERFFTTAAEYPRAIFAEGSHNVRDIGMLPIEGGGKVKQGMIYRGGKLEDGFGEHDGALTKRGIRQLRDFLGIKTVIDLRHEAKGRLTVSPLGEGTAYYNLPLGSYYGFFNGGNAENTKALFDILADEANYPVYIHCSCGADRTGNLALIIETLLGVPRRYIEMDFNMTALTVFDQRCWYRNGVLDPLFGELTGGDDTDSHETRAVKRMTRKLRDTFGIAEETVEKVRGLLT